MYDIYNAMGEVLCLEVVLLLLIVYLAAAMLIRLFNILSGNKKLHTEMEALAKQKRLLDERNSQLNRQEAELKQRRLQLNQQEDYIEKRLMQLDVRGARLNAFRAKTDELVRARTVVLAKSIASRSYLSTTPAFSALSSDSVSYERLLSVLTNDMQVESPFDISAMIKSGNKLYHTTLFNCDCYDFQFRGQPCKHMMRLAVELGVVLGIDTTPLENEVSDLLKVRRKLVAEKTDAIKKKQLLQRLESTQEQSYPWLSKLRTEAYEAVDKQYIDFLTNKSHPAVQTAAEIKKIVYGELRQSRLAEKQFEYQLHFYESLFPWLKDFREIPPVEAFSYASGTIDDSVEENYETFKEYISPNDWQNLSSTEKYQLILDRYISRRKNNWEIGIEYERYIGYLCEQAGYSVTYNGARTKLEDMGRDLILRRGNTTVLVQCKRWSERKIVHENHIFQLTGSLFEYQYQHPEQQVTGVFITSTSLSAVASVARRLLESMYIREFNFLNTHVSNAMLGVMAAKYTTYQWINNMIRRLSVVLTSSMLIP